ncbi:MAG TPA: cohesin domain-containing protein [Rhodocyclaceae bacterium]|nr:cohesin domain-containing protein [Rhodocyclaceae bacterium]
MTSRTPHVRLISLAVALALWGCADQTLHRQGLNDLAQGRVEDGLGKLEQAMRQAPNNLEYRIHYFNARDQVVNTLIATGQRLKDAGQLDEAEAAYRRAIRLGGDNLQATDGLADVAQARRHQTLLAEARSLLGANDLDGAEQRLRKILQENPRHKDARTLLQEVDERNGRNQVLAPSLRRALQKPVTLEFRDASLRQVMEALSMHSGLNFIIDKDVPTSITITVFLRGVSVEDALDVMLGTNQLGRRVLNNNTLLIYPDTTAKQGDLQDLVVKNFFLANAEAKNAANMLRTVLKAKNVYSDDKLNLLVMRDTPNMIRLAERLIATQDVPEPEVMLEVQVAEVKRTSLLNLGIQWPDQLTLTPLASGANLTLQDVRSATSSTTGATISPLIINLLHQVSDSNILANPRLRTHNREKAMIRIGDRVPVITTTATSTGFVSENVQYLDVGLRLEVEPTIFPNDEIALRLGLEVSSITSQVVSKSGSISYQIGGRNASTVLRLRDGETQVLGGLIDNEDRMTANRVPGLGDLPILNRLFGSQADNDSRTELLLSITPHIVRGLAPPANVPAEFWSGTENNPRLKPLSVTGEEEKPALAPSPAVASNVAPVATLETGGAAPAVPAVPSEPPSATLSWDGPPQVKAGDTVHLSLRVSTGNSIRAFPLRIQYDPTVFTASDPIGGRFMTQGGAIAETRAQVDPDTGTITVNQIRNGTGGAQGDGELLRIDLQAKQATTGSAVTVQPSAPLGTNGQSLTPTRPVAINITVTP